LGKRARSITRYLTFLFSGRRFSRVKRTATNNALSNDTAEKGEYGGNNTAANCAATYDVTSVT
jgi:hypothetical protein